MCTAESEPHIVEKMGHTLGKAAGTMPQTSGATRSWRSRLVTETAFIEKQQELLLSRVMPYGNKLLFRKIKWVVGREISRKENCQETIAIIQV